MTTYPWYQQLAMGREVQRSLQVCPWCHDDRMKIRRGSICAVLLLIACAGGETPALRQPVPLSSPAAPVKPSEPPPVSVSTASFDSTDAAPEPVDPFANTAFPPPNFDPPHERSAREGDGRWVRMGDERKNESAAKEPAVLYRTTVHPHPVSKFISVTIAAMDLKHTSLHLVAGTDDPGADKAPRTRGLVPLEHQSDLVLVHNGGFKPQHGNWGMMAEGEWVVPTRDEGCTVLITNDDRAVMGTWSSLSAHAPQARSIRQTPPCLVEANAIHPKLLAGDARAWGGTAKDIKTRRRTAIGIDASGRVLLFGMGEEADPKLLGEAMKVAGAQHAAQLDINYNWTRFLLFGTPDGVLQVTSTLIPKMVHRKRGYVALSEDRDFFYLKRR
ncbi:MAG TPA: hypothetical protein PKW66_03005 [Polyangiaceae bacterium]|nr:hypothetical protein [Polyangiaceae bacterium]